VSVRLGWPILGLWLLALGVSPLSAQKWQIQYFYDHAKSTFVVCDLQFPSANRGVAVGVIRTEKRDSPMSVVTSDGGQHWQEVPLKEAPISLFFLNENLGWLVTAKGIWQTEEAGRSWTKLPKGPAGILRVYFVSETRGWAIGDKKTAVETKDGGKTWTPLSAPKPEETENTRYTSYTWITFRTPLDGVITGWNIPPLIYGPPLPSWMDPEASLRRRDVPHVLYALSTSDGGATWTASSSPSFGAIGRIRLSGPGKGLELVQYGETFRYPSEILTFDTREDANHTVYRDTKFSVSDLWLASDGTAYLSGTAVRGKMRGIIPERVRVLTSKDYENWTPIPVDYRTEATATMLASSDDDHLWMATDTGMILKLVR
jgi:hypothetical protein